MSSSLWFAISPFHLPHGLAMFQTEAALGPSGGGETKLRAVHKGHACKQALFLCRMVSHGSCFSSVI